MLLLLLLLWGIECVGGWVSQVGAGDPTNPRSLLGSWGLDGRNQMKVQKSVTVQEGRCVFIPCTFSYPVSSWKVSNPVLGYWFQKKDKNIYYNQDAPVATNDPDTQVKKETKGRFQLLGDPRNRSCSLVIRQAHMEDTAIYLFQVDRSYYRKFNSILYTLALEVTGLTQKPYIYVPETLQPGCQATLLCAFPQDFEGCPAPTFSWLGVAVSSRRAGLRAPFFSALTLVPRPEDNDTEVTCRVNFSRKGVSTSSTIRLSVDREFGDKTLECRDRSGAQGAGKPKPGREFVQAAFVGAGLCTFLFLCPCLICLMVKHWRRKATKTTTGRSGVPSVLKTIAGAHQEKSRPNGSPDIPPWAIAATTLEEEQELQYASIVFHELKPQKPQLWKASNTTYYEEIKIGP